MSCYRMEDRPNYTTANARIDSRQPSAFGILDNYCVWNIVTGTPVESHFSETAAQYACDILNDHNNNLANPKYDEGLPYRYFRFNVKP